MKSFALRRFRPVTFLKVLTCILVVGIVVALSNNEVVSVDHSVMDISKSDAPKLDRGASSSVLGQGERTQEANTKEALIEENPEYRRRIIKAYDECLKRPAGNVSRVMVTKDKSAAICIVPKVGCTHWINVFRFINNNTDGNLYARPADIPRRITHYAPKDPEFKIREGTIPKTGFLSKAFRFMFVRHPINRLWSAWLDKFYLPSFWETSGRQAAKLLKLPTLDQKCPTNITFNQFLSYVTLPMYQRNPAALDEHWRPVQYQCDPCVFRPHLIGKMETFGHDSKVALSVMDFDKYLQRAKTAMSINGSKKATTQTEKSVTADAIWTSSPYGNDRSVYEMKILSHFNLELDEGSMKSVSTQRIIKDCHLTNIFIARRLWETFQFNGHIRSDSEFPLTQWNLADWHKALLKAYALWPKDLHLREKQQRDQKKRLYIENYKAIPTRTMLKLKNMFSFDFEQYGYEFD